MIIFFYGADIFRSSLKIKELKNKFLKEVDPSGMNLIELEGENLTMDEFHSAVSAVSFLAKKRMVIIKNLISKNTSKTLQHDIYDSLHSSEQDIDNVIVFFEASSSLKGELYNFLKNQKFTTEFTTLTPPQLQQWIVSQLTSRNCTIEKNALQLLAQYVGSDLFLLENELDKLVSFVHPVQVISVSDVEKHVHKEGDSVIFHFIDAICNREKKRVFELLDAQYASGANDLYLVSMLLRQVRILIIIKQYNEQYQSNNAYEISKKFGIHSFVVQKSLQQSRKFQLNDLLRYYKALLQLDIDIKTGYASPRLLLDLFVAQMS